MRSVMGASPSSSSSRLAGVSLTQRGPGSPLPARMLMPSGGRLVPPARCDQLVPLLRPERPVVVEVEGRRVVDDLVDELPHPLDAVAPGEKHAIAAPPFEPQPFLG